MAEIKRAITRMVPTSTSPTIIVIVILGPNDPSVDPGGRSEDGGRGGGVLDLDLHTAEPLPIAPLEHEIGGLGSSD